MTGALFALLIGVCGIIAGIYAALAGHDWLGGIVATISIGTLAGNFIRNRTPPPAAGS